MSRSRRPHARAALHVVALGATAPLAFAPAFAQSTVEQAAHVAPAVADAPVVAEAPVVIAQAGTDNPPVVPQTSPDKPAKSLGVVTITAGRPTSLPTNIPATMESATREEIERTVNATDSADAIKYFPSLLVRKRYIGDYNHAILSTRASGTGNSARSMVYGDGILLSNLLGNGVNGLTYPPRWGLVTPEEIERVDVMYGPFSAAYPGNSVGAVVDYVTRMPDKFEAHAAMGYAAQPGDLYGDKRTWRSWQTSASVGSRADRWSYWFNVSRQDTQSQPLTFATRLTSAGTAGTAGTPVNGAILGANNARQPWYILGYGTQYDTVQDHAKLKLAFDITPTMRASYTLGAWQNTSVGSAGSYLSNAAGAPVSSGAINVGGLAFTGANALTGADFTQSRQAQTHVIHGLSLKTSTKETFDWEVAASLYDYSSDTLRQNSAANVLPGALNGGPGTLLDGEGTGWNTLALKGTWRPQGIKGEHIVDFGLQRDAYTLRMNTFNVTGDWRGDGPSSLASSVRGQTELTSLWAQDTWSFAPRWKTVLGLRAENWSARDGETFFSATSATAFPSRTEHALSPKAAISYQWAPDIVVKGALGRAVRNPTVMELYGATSTTNSQFINDPNLKPERSWTGELTVEKSFATTLLRVTAFAENTRDALYSQTLFDPLANRNVSRVQNVDLIETRGLEVAVNSADAFVKGLDIQGSVTYADSIIKENAGFVVTPGDTVGKWQPNIPRWRATLLTSYRITDKWSASLGARYSGTQYRTLNNADVNGFTYQGVSKYFTVDLRTVYKLDKTWTMAAGIDNVNNANYWNFHPYPQRTFHLNLRADI